MKLFFSVVFIFLTHLCLAQYFQFSQYNFTPQRINPAQVAVSDYAELHADYRSQGTSGGFRLNSSMLNVSYPLQTKKGGRWSGIGISLMDDRSGQAGIYNTQEIGLSYAVNINLERYQSLSLGVKGLYQIRKVDLDELYTGSQYVADRGFDRSIASGENPGYLKSNYATFSAGIHWQQTDKKGIVLQYLSVSFFDFNRPDDSFMNSGSHLNPAWVGMAGFRIYHEGNMSITPEVLYTRGAGNNSVIAGAIFRCDLNSRSSQVSPHVDFITKYAFARYGILGFQYHNDVFSAGFSYDFPIGSKNVSNTGAIEVAVSFRTLVVRKKSKQSVDKSGRRIAPVSSGKVVKKIITPETTGKPASIKTAADSAAAKPADDDMSSRLKHKQDSVRTQSNGNREPRVLEKTTLYFNFKFNSTEPDGYTVSYLDDLANALLNNPELKVSLEGHTDNVGSNNFNLQLSDQRAQAVRNYLIKKGVNGSRITARGKGMLEPLNGNKTEEERSKNRRVDLIILY